MTWLLTCAGAEYNLKTSWHNAPLSLNEIASSLAKINRFNGHTSRPYSVAEHSLLVLDIAKEHTTDARVLLAALLHDAHECITGDVPSPIKQMLRWCWSPFENQHQDFVQRQFCISEISRLYHSLIKACDLVALATERRDLMPFDAAKHMPWPILDTPGESFAASTTLSVTSMNPNWYEVAEAFEEAATDLISKGATAP